ncbi:hypothetical protein NOVOSPHI9U_460010 [Novosphingobium sp. 9U]|nr:hypothetical protein NOVOSPHI9U_460010 [Novosphingobium sp. 9U]
MPFVLYNVHVELVRFVTSGTPGLALKLKSPSAAIDKAVPLSTVALRRRSTCSESPTAMLSPRRVGSDNTTEPRKLAPSQREQVAGCGRRLSVSEWPQVVSEKGGRNGALWVNGRRPREDS